MKGNVLIPAEYQQLFEKVRRAVPQVFLWRFRHEGNELVDELITGGVLYRVEDELLIVKRKLPEDVTFVTYKDTAPPSVKDYERSTVISRTDLMSIRDGVLLLDCAKNLRPRFFLNLDDTDTMCSESETSSACFIFIVNVGEDIGKTCAVTCQVWEENGMPRHSYLVSSSPEFVNHIRGIVQLGRQIENEI